MTKRAHEINRSQRNPSPMAEQFTRDRGRDYRLGGESDRRAVEAGLAEASCYRSPIDRDLLAKLSERSDGAAARTTALYVVLLVATGLWAYSSLWSWWTGPALLLYGTLYGSSADPRWHECGHGTAFRTRWLNDAVYYPASFMVLRDPTVWRWSHVRHHSDTIIVGRDPEVVLKRPPRLRVWLLALFALPSGIQSIARTFRHSVGRVSEADLSYIAERDIGRVVIEARVFVFIWTLLIGWCVLSMSLVPLLFFVGPSFYGAWLVHLFGTSQHLGLRENVLDHRLNTRTIYMNPILRFLYWNMNYHCEHHMFPAVPSHALPKLHEAIKADLPVPSRSLVHAYREIGRALFEQRRDPSWELDRPLPASAGTRLEREVRSFRPERTDDSDWLDVCGADDLKVDAIAKVDILGRSLALYRLESGYRATDGICTHSRRVHLAEGTVVGSEIECAKHNGRFDILTGIPTRLPVCIALSTYETRVRRGRVEILLGLPNVDQRA
jgi:Na+-transporting NADH:ubiquinone oxidoreductase subunit F